MQQVLYYLRGILALVYILISVLILTDVLQLKFALGNIKIPFALVLLAYGVFRIYRVVKDFKK